MLFKINDDNISHSQQQLQTRFSDSVFFSSSSSPSIFYYLFFLAFLWSTRVCCKSPRDPLKTHGVCMRCVFVFGYFHFWAMSYHLRKRRVAVLTQQNAQANLLNKLNKIQKKTKK